MTQQAADLVLEGGGVKGLALVGAVLPLAEAGYRFPRVAGTSSGAMIGAFVAALNRRGESLDRLADVAATLDIGRFRDRGPVASRLGPLALVADAVSLFRDSGIYEGDYLRDWVAGSLADLGVETFGDLRVDDAEGDGEIHHRYGLVVTASDLSRQRFVKLPWDFADYGLDPDEQSVAGAVRASSSIPFFYEPVRLRAARGEATLVDGGLLSNYPINVFDRLDERLPRWPTIGVRLSAREPVAPPQPVSGPLALALALVETAIEARQPAHVAAACDVARTIFVETEDVGVTEFELSPEELKRLVAAGREATGRFLTTWDYRQWLEQCRGVEPT
jgi:NTE family protein